MKQIAIITSMIVCGLFNQIYGQVTLPYYNNFDNPNDTIGWTHYAIIGTDDWEIGIPTGTLLNSSVSAPNVWATNLNGAFTANSLMCLETPFFDFSDTTTTYRIGFSHQIQTNSNHGGNMDYSLDSGQTWQVLNGSSKAQWYNQINCSGLSNEPSWSFSYYASGFKYSYHLLDLVKGQASVKFRFKFGATSNPQEGWVIDNFNIAENLPNIFPVSSQPIHVTKQCQTFEFSSTLIFRGIRTSTILNTTNYYWSFDSIFDSGDSLIGTDMQNITNNSISWNNTLALPANLSSGVYYLFYLIDADSILIEVDELDNVGKVMMVVDSIYNIPLISHFDNSGSLWGQGENNGWQLTPGFIHHFEGTHSGQTAWSILNAYRFDINYIESPHIDLSLLDSTVISFWYRLKTDITNYANIEPIRFSLDCNDDFYNIAELPRMRENTWDFYNSYLPIQADTSKDVRIRIYNDSDFTPCGTCYFGRDMVIDDVYIGKAKADLSVERDKLNRFSSSSFVTDTLKYYFNNGGLRTAQQTITAFYWSNDSILDGTDVLLGTKQEPSIGDTTRVWTNFVYSKPNTSPGTYYIFYVLDNANAVDEMREYNNTGYFTLHQENNFTVPYFNDFESQIIGWRHNATLNNDDWQWSNPQGTVLDTSFSGTKAWITSDTGFVNKNSRMHLYSPIFDFSTTINPVLEFDMKLDRIPVGNDGKTNMSYSTDGGATWVVLDTTNQSYNRWYYPMEYAAGIDYNDNYPTNSELLFNVLERTFASYTEYNSRDAQRNTRYILDLSFLGGISQVQFRYNLATWIDFSGNNTYQVEGALIDNFSISESFVDLNVSYKKALMLSSNAQEIKFFMDIKNQGNYFSSPSTTKYYVSTDTILDASDYFLGQASIPVIRPDLSFYVNQSYTAPSNLSNYQYLLYELDEANTNAESNEVNNIGYWHLALDSINNYPYFNNFNDTVVDGWYQHSIQHLLPGLGNYRFRNMVAPGEILALNTKKIESGQWFTERSPFGSWNTPPYNYLQSPAFNFSYVDSIFMSFNLMCSGRNSTADQDGGNLHYSTDGGNTWTVLTASFGPAHNWYNNSSLSNLDNEAGWTGTPYQTGPILLDSSSIDASFLKGEEHVVFRFKYKSNWEYFGANTEQGMRLDNFRIEAYTVDYVANDTLVQVNATLLQPDFNINYSITNLGQSNGRITSTKFFWSSDSIFDANDSLIHTVTENPISSGNTFNSSATITYPYPLNQIVYYLFYFTDADSNLLETDEFNNYGSYKVTFPAYPNYYANNQLDTINALIAQPTINVVYSTINNGFMDGVNSTATFYWSVDNNFDAGDQIIHTVNESPILIGDTLTSSTIITYPTPVTQITYYLFYIVDNNDEILETNEGDNIGVFKIIFDSVNSISDHSLFSNTNIYVYENSLFVVTPTSFYENSFSLKMLNTNCQITYNADIELRAGVNRFMLPKNLSSGIYLIHLYNCEGILTRKTIIQN